MKQDSPWYRADIEGLRGIAVLSVVFFHFDYQWFSGGALGVDMFFVISGFLITSLIVREQKQNTFSLSEFWSRRIRRILPALTVFMLAISLYMYSENPPFSSFENVGEAITTQSVFVSNIYFLHTVNLLEPANSTRPEPLTHTWSLSVEEQFYVIFPLLLIILLSYSRNITITGLAVVTTTSFIFFIYLTELDPFGNFPFSDHVYLNIIGGFYMFPARAWELLLGSLGALVAIRLSPKGARALSASGALLIGVGLIVTIILPGWERTLPVLGTLFIIIANTSSETPVKKFLSWSPLVWVGSISYSLYLWHWPIYQFYREAHGYAEVPLHRSIGLLIVSLTIAAISYEFVEKPFLKKKNWNRKKVYLFGIGAMIITALAGIVIQLSS
ncbi:MAG: hypothetical protein RL538_577 [Candidatus Parcubacteria bacterium]|jgi:peptidoglycan/LPS O-acetylase OafA/YrhL